jgi:uncharacterized protein YrzB (UPF0473 family)
MGTVLKPILQPTPGSPPTHNFGLCETFSYIPVEGAGRPLYARASYITNFSDMSIHLSAGELAIGAVTIKDNDSGLNCDVVTDPDNGLNALRVITQDLESVYDDITIGDKNGIYYATIDGPLSSLNVKVTNLSALENSLQNQIILLDSLSSLILKEFDETQILLLSSFLETNTNLSSFQLDFNLQLEETQTLLDSLTALQENKQDQIITLLHQLTSNTDGVETLLDSLTSLNQKEFNETQTLLDSLTSLQEDKQNQVITLLHQLTSNTDELENNTEPLEFLLINSNGRLDSLTAVDYSTQSKQDAIITLLDALTAKDYDIVLNAENFNLPIDSADITFNTLIIETLLSRLTSVDYSTAENQNFSITLFQQLTSNTIEIEPLLIDIGHLLNSLTSVDYSTQFKQDIIITLLESLSSHTNTLKINTNEVQSLIVNSNTLLNSLTTLNLLEFNETQTLLDCLTSLQENKQDQIITLLENLSSNTDQLISNTDHLEPLIIESNTYLEALTGIDYATEFKQDLSISLFQILTGHSEILTNNTNEVETLLNSLTSLNSLEFNETQNLLLELSSLQTHKQNLIISLLESLSSVDYSTQFKQDIIITLLNSLSSYSSSLQNNTNNLENLIINSNTLLESLTSKDYSTGLKQDSVITLLTTLTAQKSIINIDLSAINLNTDEVEGLIFNTNTLLNSLTAKTTITNISGLETRLDVLTSTDFSTQSKQEEIISLLQTLSGNTNDLENILENSNSYLNSLTGVLFATEPKQDSIITLLEVLTGKDTITILNPVTSVEILNSNLNVTVLNPVTTVEVTNLNDIETKLDVLTSIDYASEFKQDSIITLLDALTANTNNTEELLIQTNTFLNSLTSTLLTEFNQTQTLLESLTSKENRQVEIVTLLNQLTSNTDAIETLIDSLTSLNQTEFNEIQELLKPLSSINSSLVALVSTDFATASNQLTSQTILSQIETNSFYGTTSTQPLFVTTEGNSFEVSTTVNSFGINSDAFGRLRISSPYTLFDSSHRYQDNNLWNTLTAEGGTCSFNPSQGLIDMSISDLSGSKVYRETTKVFSYQAGKSLLILNTFVFSPSAEHLRQRVGYFGNTNGLFLELNGSELNFVKRTSISGGIVEEKKKQEEWNVNPLLTSLSGTPVLDITKVQIFWMDIEWLGAGTVRMGFVIDGKFIHCHSFHHANLIDSTYITTASLPLRYEIENLENTLGFHNLKQICSSVISEGGYELRGEQKNISIDITSPKTLINAGTFYPVISLRLKSNRPDALVILSNLSLLGTGNGVNFHWKLISRGITSGGTWTGELDSVVEYNKTGTALSGGKVLASGFFTSSNQSTPTITIPKTDLFKFQLERNMFSNQFGEIILAIASGTNSEQVFASLDWEEVVH